MGEILAIATAAIWSVAMVLFRKSGDHVSPVALNFFKNVVATACFMLTFAVVRVPLLPHEALPSDWILLAVSGILGITLADAVFFASLNRLGAGLSAIIGCLQVPFTGLIAFAAIGERWTAGHLAGAAVIVAAVVLTYTPRSGRPGVSRRDYGVGIIYGVVAMLLMATAVVIAKPVLERSSVLWASSVRLAAGVLFQCLYALHRPYRAAIVKSFRPDRNWLVTLPGSFLGAYLAMFLWIGAMKYTQVSIVATLTRLSAVFVPVLAYIALGESLTLRKISAALLGLAGVAVLLLL